MNVGGIERKLVSLFAEILTLLTKSERTTLQNFFVRKVSAAVRVNKQHLHQNGKMRWLGLSYERN